VVSLKILDDNWFIGKEISEKGKAFAFIRMALCMKGGGRMDKNMASAFSYLELIRPSEIFTKATAKMERSMDPGCILQ
jgi:hypothetical protein